MAQTFRTDEVVFGDDSEIPSNVYTAAITKFDFGKSQAGNPQFVLGCEITDPVQVTFKGQNVNVAGRAFTIYNSADPSDRERGLGRLISGLTKAGLKPSEVQELGEGEAISTEPELMKRFLGKQFQVYIRCQPDIMMRLATPEELEINPKLKYVEVLDGNRKPAIKGYKLSAFMTDIIGPAMENNSLEVPPWE